VEDHTVTNLYKPNKHVSNFRFSYQRVWR